MLWGGGPEPPRSPGNSSNRWRARPPTFCRGLPRPSGATQLHALNTLVQAVHCLAICFLVAFRQGVLMVVNKKECQNGVEPRGPSRHILHPGSCSGAPGNGFDLKCASGGRGPELWERASISHRHLGGLRPKPRECVSVLSIGLNQQTASRIVCRFNAIRVLC